jgi:hypothetical protein
MGVAHTVGDSKPQHGHHVEAQVQPHGAADLVHRRLPHSCRCRCEPLLRHGAGIVQ